MRTVGARRDHRYEDRAARQVYVIPAGQARMLPDDVAELLVGAHPEKLYFADAGGRGEAAPDPPVSAEGQTTGSRAVGRRGRRRRNRPGRT